jgi:heme exporter protein B
VTTLRDAALVAGKDLRLELRSRVTTNQVAPFALLVLLLFGFALDGDRRTLDRTTPGLFWLAVLFCTVLAVQRSFALESADGNRDALRLSGLSSSGILLGKGIAVAGQLLVLQAVLILGVAVLYSAKLETPLLLLATCVAATTGLAAAGTLFGALAAGLRVRDTLLPLLLMPMLAPVLIAATRSFEDALGTVGVNGWAWVNLLLVFAVAYTALTLFCAASLLEDS